MKKSNFTESQIIKILAAQIRRAPSYFLNGRELPQIYSISDLGYFLKS